MQDNVKCMYLLCMGLKESQSWAMWVDGMFWSVLVAFLCVGAQASETFNSMCLAAWLLIFKVRGVWVRGFIYCWWAKTKRHVHVWWDEIVTLLWVRKSQEGSYTDRHTDKHRPTRTPTWRNLWIAMPWCQERDIWFNPNGLLDILKVLLHTHSQSTNIHCASPQRTTLLTCWLRLCCG